MIKTFGSAKQLEDDKDNFINITIGKDEGLRSFGRRFVAEAKSISQLISLTPRELATALLNAIKPLPYLNVFRSRLIGPIDSETVFRTAETLSSYKSLGNTYPQRTGKVFLTEQDEEEEAYHVKPQVLRGLCHYCGKEGHWMRTCPKRCKEKPEEKSQAGVHFAVSDSSESEEPKKFKK